MNTATARLDRASRTRVATRAALVELLRRWPTLVFMLVMPLAYFLISFVTSDPAQQVPGPQGTLVADRDVKAVYLAVLGIGITASFGALTVVRPKGSAIRRLRLMGYSAWQLLTARLVTLGLACLSATALFLTAFIPLVNPRNAPGAVAAALLVALIGIALGTVVGLLVPREFEASMTLVAFAGMQMALGRGGSDVQRFLPYWPGVDALERATFVGAPTASSLLLGAGYVLVGLAAGLGLWALRTRITRRSSGPGVVAEAAAVPG